MKTLLIILLLFFTGLAYGQKEAANWYFGNLGFSFNTLDGSPKVLYDRMDKSFLFNSSIISDKQGNLLFYTDGDKVWNKEHKVMKNGDNLNCFNQSRIGIIIIPFVNDDTKYYIFACGNFLTKDTALYYSVVEMSNDSGRGEVTIKRKFLYSPVSAYLTGIRHENKTDIWLITHEFDNENYLSFLINNQGIQNIPVKTAIGSKINNGSKECYYPFNINISPKSKKLALGSYENLQIELLDFNASTGILSNFNFIPYSNIASNSIAHVFSSDGSKLYVFIDIPPNSSSLEQYDMNYSSQLDLLNSKKTIISGDNAFWFYYSDLRLAPNGKIYCYHLGNNIGIINRPNETGWKCNFVTQRFFNGNHPSFCVFPNIFPEFVVNENFKITSNSPICEGDSILLFGDNVSSAKYQWTGPNGFSSNEPNPVIRKAITGMSGYYYLKTDDFTYNVYVLVDTLPKVNIKVLGSTNLCSGDKTILQADVSQNADFWWSNDVNSPEISVSKAGRYTLYAMNKSGCIDSSFVEIKVFPSPKPKLNNNKDTTICSSQTLILTTTKIFSSYKWSDNSTTDSIRITKSGVYNVTVVDSNGCSGTSERVIITVNPVPKPKISGSNSVCRSSEADYSISDDTVTKKSWQVTGGNIIGSSEENIINVHWDAKGIGRITVTQTDTITGCSGTDTMIVVINDSLKPKITATKNTLCKDEILKLSASDGYEKYLWNTGDTTKEILTGKSGEYSVLVKDESGCTGTSDKIVITNAPPPQPSIAGDTLFCAGTANALICRGDFVSYNWSTGETTRQISVSQPGTYSLTVTDTNGCSGSASIEVKNYIVNITGLQDLNFGKINYGKSDTILLTWKNESNTPISIKNVYLQKNSPEFSILTKPALPAMLAVNQTIDVTIVFTPKENKASTDSIIAKLDLPCQKVLSSFLSSETASGETYVWLPDTTGTVGEKDFCIPLKASVTQPFAQTGSLGFAAVIKFDATALLPDSIYVSYLIDGVRYVELSDSNVTFQNGTAKLGEFCGTILLANQDLTPVYIDKFGWNQPGIETAKKDGSLSLTGICARNISRIILFDNGALTISPNPANDYINISVGAQQAVPEGIKIFDVFGQEYLTPTLSTSGEGVRIDVSSLSTGVYFVRVGNKVSKFVKF